jgi:translation elongation factor EF-4
MWQAHTPLPRFLPGKVMELCTSRRGSLTEHAVVGGDRQLLRFVLPLSELASDLYSRLKSVSQGYASFDYEEGQYRTADLARLDIMVNGQVVDALARMVHVDRIQQEGGRPLGSRHRAHALHCFLHQPEDAWVCGGLQMETGALQ